MRYHYCYLFDGEPQSIYLEAGVSFTKLSGHRYTILAVTNLHPGLSNQPVSLVYRSEDQQTYCAPIERALRGVTHFQPPSNALTDLPLLNQLEHTLPPISSSHRVVTVLMLANQTATLPEFPLQCVFSLGAAQLYSMPYSQSMSHFAAQEPIDACPPHLPDSG